MTTRKQKPTKKRRTYDATDRLLRAAGTFVEQRGGKAVVAGPIKIMELSERKFLLCVEIVGRRPQKVIP